MKLIRMFCLILTLAAFRATGQSVVINEFRNNGGANGGGDVVELVVVQQPTLDMRGMILKDYSSSGNGDNGGGFTFTSNALWAAVPAGTIILLTNDTGAVDVDASDFTLNVGLKNTNYFTVLSGTFDIATTEIVQIKSNGAARAGSVGAIHSFATSGVTNQFFTAAGGEKLQASGTVGTATPDASATTPNALLSDYDGTSAVTGTTDTLGTFNNANNQTFIMSLRTGSGGVANPNPFTATIASSNSIQLSWGINASNDSVVIAFSTNGTFGTPMGSYNTNDLVAGGGQMIYIGSGTGFLHTNLNQATTYFYRGWSIDGTNYSFGASANVSTPIYFPPTISITNPPDAFSNFVDVTVSNVILQGTGTNLAGTLTWSNLATGATGTSAAGATWNSTAIPVIGGPNYIVIRGANADGFATTATTLVFRAGMPSPTDAPVWINELHYDNVGTDTNEGYEIAGPAGIDLSAYSIVLYDGYSSHAYSNSTLSGILPNQVGGYGTLWFGLPVNGLQNGNTNGNSNGDGLALMNGSNLVQFLSYEGTMIAQDGPAAGYASINLPVDESSPDAVGFSIELTGFGNHYSNFSWTGPVTNTMGSFNVSQIISGPPSYPAIAITTPPLTSNDVPYEISSIDLTGTVVNIFANMSWTNLSTGVSGTFSAGSPWTAAGVPLAVGPNQIVVYGVSGTAISTNASTIVNRAASLTPPPPTNITVAAIALGANPTVYSTGTNSWSVLVEYCTNLLGTSPVWITTSNTGNSFVNGTNVTTFIPPTNWPYFIRVRQTYP